MNFNNPKFLLRGVVLISVILFAFTAYLLFVDEKEESDEQEEKQDYVLSVNGTGFTGEQVEKYKSEVARNLLRQGESDVSEERILDDAVKRITREVVSKNYYREKGVSVSQNEVEDIIRGYVSEYPGVERQDDFFRTMEMRGYKKEEIIRGTELLVSHDKAIFKLSQEMEITEDDVKEEYNKYVEMYDGEDVLPLEDIYEDFLEAVLYQRADDNILQELEKRKEGAEIVFYQ